MRRRGRTIRVDLQYGQRYLDVAHWTTNQTRDPAVRVYKRITRKSEETGLKSINHFNVALHKPKSLLPVQSVVGMLFYIPSRIVSYSVGKEHPANGAWIEWPHRTRPQRQMTYHVGPSWLSVVFSCTHCCDIRLHTLTYHNIP